MPETAKKSGRTGRIALRSAALVLTLAVCAAAFLFSGADGAKTSAVSSSIAGDVVRQTVKDYEDLEAKWQRAHLKTLEGVLRKFAHCAEYFAMGFFASLFAVSFLEREEPSEKKKRRWALPLLLFLAFLFCALFAASDELHQFFTPGRDGNVADVLLDALSAAIGVLIVGGAAQVWLNGGKGTLTTAEGGR